MSPAPPTHPALWLPWELSLAWRRLEDPPGRREGLGEQLGTSATMAESFWALQLQHRTTTPAKRSAVSQWGLSI